MMFYFLRMKFEKNNVSSKEAEILRDFESLSTVKPEDKRLYMQACLKTGQKMMASQYVVDGNNQKFSVMCGLDQFRKYGPGIYLLFLFMKYCAIILGICSVLSLISVGLLLQSDKIFRQQSNFQIALAYSTIGNMEEQKAPAIIALDFIMTIIMTSALIFWKEREARLILECSQQVILPSYYTVILDELPLNYTEKQMKHYLQENFGRVHELYTVRKFGNDLFHYHEITNIIDEFKEERGLLILEKEIRNSKKLTKLFFEFRNYYIQMRRQIKKNMKYRSCFAFISFEDIKTRQQIIQHYNSQTMCFNHRKINGVNLYKDQSLSIKPCYMEPDGIVWENVDISKGNRIFRILMQMTLLFIVFFLSIIIIFIFSFAELNLLSSEYTGLTRGEILDINTPDSIRSYCLTLSLKAFETEKVLCDEFKPLYTELTLIAITVPVLIGLLKFVLTELMKALVAFRRYPYEISRLKSEVMIMFVFYFFATGILQLILFIKIEGQGFSISFISLMIPFAMIFSGLFPLHPEIAKVHSDFTQDWYLSISSKIIIIGMMSFLLSAFAKVAYSIAREKACRYFANKQKIQIQMNSWLVGESIELEFVYAVALTIIFFALLYMGPMPVILPFSFISMAALYWTTKLIFVKYCAKPLVYSECVNTMIINICFGGIIMHCLITPIFFKASTIGNSESTSILLRILDLGFYLSVVGAIIIYVLFRDRIMHFVHCRISEWEEGKKREKPGLCTQISKVSAKCGSLEFSYSMHESPRYKEVLLTLYTLNKKERRRGTFFLHNNVGQHLKKSENTRQRYKMFNELLELVKRDSKRFKRKLANNKETTDNVQNPFEKDRKVLEEIHGMIDQQNSSQAMTMKMSHKELMQITMDKLQSHYADEQEISEMMKSQIKKTLKKIDEIGFEESSESDSKADKVIKKEPCISKFQKVEDKAAREEDKAVPPLETEERFKEDNKQ